MSQALAWSGLRRVRDQARKEVERHQTVLTSSRRNKKAKGENNASRKTWNQAPRQAEKNPRPRQRLFPYKIEAIPFRQRSGRTRPEVRLFGTQAAQTPIPVSVDRAHRRGRKRAWTELLALHQRTEESRSRTRSQDSCGSRGEGSGRL